MKIIPAKPLDFAGIRALLEDCQLPTVDLTVAHLEHFFVIKENDQISGSIGLEICGEFGLLRSLALAVPLRKLGLGAQLVERIENYASSQHITELYLLTTTAEQFFIHRNYQVIPRENVPATLQKTTEFQSICPASAVCMKKTLAKNKE